MAGCRGYPAAWFASHAGDGCDSSAAKVTTGCSTTEAFTLTIQGINFGELGDALSVTVGGIECADPVRDAEHNVRYMIVTAICNRYI